MSKSLPFQQEGNLIEPANPGTYSLLQLWKPVGNPVADG